MALELVFLARLAGLPATALDVAFETDLALEVAFFAWAEATFLTALLTLEVLTFALAALLAGAGLLTAFLAIAFLATGFLTAVFLAAGFAETS